jgi:DNA-binding HxlR family transcriptional regulator
MTVLEVSVEFPLYPPEPGTLQVGEACGRFSVNFGTHLGSQNARSVNVSDRIIACISQVIFDSVSDVPGRPKSKRRSGCPVSISLERFGDRWSLLIIRDLMVRGFRTFKEFEESGEGIATNILADRLQRLQTAGILTAEVEEMDGRRVNYRLTEKGIDLAPVLLELLIWGSRHEEAGVSCSVIEKMAKNRNQVLAEVRRRWRERDSTPLIPIFGNGGTGRNLVRKRP